MIFRAAIFGSICTIATVFLITICAINEKNQINETVESVSSLEIPKVFLGNTKEEIDRFFIAHDSALSADCECFSKHFEITKQQCIEESSDPPHFDKCVRDVFEFYNQTNFNPFINCTVNIIDNCQEISTNNCKKFADDDIEYEKHIYKCNQNLKQCLKHVHYNFIVKLKECDKFQNPLTKESLGN